MKVTVILPYIRPEKVKRCIAAIRVNAGVPDDDYTIMAVEDTERVGVATMVKRLVDASTTEFICFLGDDTVPQPGFLAAALEDIKRFPDSVGLVAFNDGTGRQLATHWLASKCMLPLVGGEFFSTAYKHLFCDNELTDRATSLGRYYYSQTAVVHHDHPLLMGQALDDADDDYKRVYASDAFKADQKTYRRRKMGRQGFGLALCLPLVDNMVGSQFAITLVTLDIPAPAQLMVPKYEGSTFLRDVAIARNNLVTQALNAGCSHVAMLDTDQIYHDPQTLKKMRVVMEETKAAMVAAPVHRRYPPFDPIMYRGMPGRYNHVPDNECYSGKAVDVDAVGCGCVLYDSKVFLELDPPWFEFHEKEGGGGHVGEDLWFCHRMRQGGYRVVVDTSIVIDHLTTMAVNRKMYELFKLAQGHGFRTLPSAETDYPGEMSMLKED